MDGAQSQHTTAPGDNATIVLWLCVCMHVCGRAFDMLCCSADEHDLVVQSRKQKKCACVI